jgi:hypothetical protein
MLIPDPILAFAEEDCGTFPGLRFSEGVELGAVCVVEVELPGTKTSPF